MARSKSSSRWLQKHFDDHYVKAAREKGYRSRSAFKLLEIQRKDHILKPSQVIIELGSAPGGWTQVISGIVGEKGKIVAVDLLPMESIANINVIQGDFTEPKVLESLIQTLDNHDVDVVLSDMAPNMSGNRSIDQPRAMHLVELVVDFTETILRKNGTMLVKVFQGEGYDQILQYVRTRFDKVVIRKPGASKSSSREMYLLAKSFN